MSIGWDAGVCLCVRVLATAVSRAKMSRMARVWLCVGGVRVRSFEEYVRPGGCRRAASVRVSKPSTVVYVRVVCVTLFVCMRRTRSL